MSRPGVRQGGVKPAPIEKRFWPKVDQGDRHLKRGEEPCDACRAGNAAKERINKARRRAAA